MGKYVDSLPTARGLAPYSSEIMLLERHLALVFHCFLEGKAAGRKTITITINGNRVQPNNPFGHPLASAYEAKTIRIPVETEDGRVMVQAYLLPTEDEITAYHKADGVEAARWALDLIGLHGKRNEARGLFIYRHDRLIKGGGWRQMWDTNDEKAKLARVIVNFDKVLDEAFKINISKQIVQLPQQLQAEIKKIADVARKDSQKKYRRKVKRVQPPATPVTGGSVTGGSTSGSDTGPLPVPTHGGPTGIPTAPLGPAPRVAVKDVKTDKFVWKVTRG